MLRLFDKHVCCDTTIISTEHHPGDTVASMNQPNQLWHYPGKVDTVSTVLKIHSVQANRSMVVDRFGLRSGGNEVKVMKISKFHLVAIARPTRYHSMIPSPYQGAASELNESATEDRLCHIHLFASDGYLLPQESDSV